MMKKENRLEEVDTVDNKLQTPKLDKFSLGFFGIIIFLLIVTLTFSVDEIERVDYNASFLPQLLNNIDKLSNEEQTELLVDMNRYIKIKVHEAFIPVYINIPRYVDTQYTWYKDYVSWWQKWSRFVRKNVWHEKASQYAYQSDNELNRVLFGNGALDQRLELVYQRTNERMLWKLSASNQKLMEEIDIQKLEAFHKENRAQIEVVAMSIEETFVTAKANLDTALKVRRAGTLGVSALLTKTIMTKLLVKSGVKIVAKAGGFWAGTTTGIAVCSPAGPWALVCGVAAGTATWIGVDFAVSQADKAITSYEFKSRLTREIGRIEDAYVHSMQQTFSTGIRQTYLDLNRSIHRRPIDQINVKSAEPDE